MRDDYLSELSCPNRDCPDFGRRGDRNLWLRWSAHGSDCRLHCATCGEGYLLQTGGVALTRVRDFCGIARGIQVVLDGEHEIGDIRYGGRRVFHLPPGSHSLSIEMDWCSSLPYELTVRPGELVELVGGARWRGFLWGLNLFVLFLLPRRTFVIRPGREARSLWKEIWEGACVFLGFLAFSCFCILLTFLLICLIVL